MYNLRNFLKKCLKTSLMLFTLMTFNYADAATVLIKVKNSDRFLSVNAKETNYPLIQRTTTIDDSRQLFDTAILADGIISLKSTGTNLCIQVVALANQAYGSVQLKACSSARADQKFVMKKMTDGTYEIRTYGNSTGLCLGPKDSSASSSIPIQQLTCTGTTAQRFNLLNNDGSAYAGSFAVTPTPVPSTNIVQSLDLINTTNGSVISGLVNGGTITAGTNLNVKANVGAQVLSVAFVLDGVAIRTETSQPLALFGDTTGSYNSGTLTAGAHVLKVTPYSGTGGSGTAGPALTIQFTAVASAPEPTPVPSTNIVQSLDLINTTNGSVISGLVNGGTITAGTNLNVKANVGAQVLSVAFVLDGVAIRTETSQPLALFGDTTGSYNSGTLTAGAHVLKVTPYSGTGGSGTAGPALTIQFTATASTPVPTPAPTPTPEPTPAPPTPPATAGSCSSISQYGITWYFDKAYPCGQFVTGDWWVIGPVVIKDMDPKDTDGVAPHMHGSMLNPSQHLAGCQGWDSRTLGHTQGNCYSDALNVAKKFPFTVANSSSLLSSASYPFSDVAPNYGRPNKNHYPYHKSVAILTVLSSAPPANSFRPPYIGQDKTIKSRWNKAYIDYSKLAKVQPLANSPALSTVLNYAVEPQIEIMTSWKGRYLHPAQNYEPSAPQSSICSGNPNYGQCIALTYGAMLLTVNMNYTNAQKEPIILRLIQMGIDFYGTAINAKETRAGVVWIDGGGHNQGRKMPTLFAGIMLGDQDIIARTNHAQYKYFQEDNQYFYVSSKDLTITHRVCCVGRAFEEYDSSDLGIPEWGSNHLVYPIDDNAAWGASYRDIAGNSTMPHVLAAILMGVEHIWNQPAIFNYYDNRFLPNMKDRTVSGTNPNGMQPYIRDLWLSYGGQ